MLRDVAIAFKTKGFFDNSNWCEKLVKPFKDLEDSEKEILNSFVVSNGFCIDVFATLFGFVRVRLLLSLLFIKKLKNQFSVTHLSFHVFDHIF